MKMETLKIIAMGPCDLLSHPFHLFLVIFFLQALFWKKQRYGNGIEISDYSAVSRQDNTKYSQGSLIQRWMLPVHFIWLKEFSVACYGRMCNTDWMS